ncbi:hypothetical protein Pcinc_037790 [Petrolisthes cinctipes]|uniref:Uncharacterized protein n=1 Tax=Petrolisthes cinctipes TaxID=88211 RepID=A0AAE1BRX0_PETCI|nr:hypothetical protein Pcinc_037790 [Petrolisthes cinctipes]
MAAEGIRLRQLPVTIRDQRGCGHHLGGTSGTVVAAAALEGGGGGGLGRGAGRRGTTTRVLHSAGVAGATHEGYYEGRFVWWQRRRMSRGEVCLVAGKADITRGSLFGGKGGWWMLVSASF